MNTHTHRVYILTPRLNIILTLSLVFKEKLMSDILSKGILQILKKNNKKTNKSSELKPIAYTRQIRGHSETRATLRRNKTVIEETLPSPSTAPKRPPFHAVTPDLMVSTTIKTPLA